MLKAYLDDSTMNGTVAVLAGWVAPAETWAAFSREWDEALRMSPRIEYFKWAEAYNFVGEFHGISEASRDEKVKLLVSVIAEFRPLGLACSVPLDLYQSIFGGNPDRVLRNPYHFCLFSIVTQLLKFLTDSGIAEKVDFYFDEQPGQMEAISNSWESLKRLATPEMKQIIGNISFCNDREVVPLQAADLSAGRTREVSEDIFNSIPPRDSPWGSVGRNLDLLARYWTLEMFEELRRLDERNRTLS